MRFGFIYRVITGENPNNYSISEMCRVMEVTCQGYHRYKKSLTKPYKYACLLVQIKAIIDEDEFNDKYGRQRLWEALKIQGIAVSQSTVYRVLNENGLLLKNKKRKPKGLTKAEKNARREADLLQGEFSSEAPNEKLIGDITQLPTIDGTLYIATIIDCFDSMVLGLAMDDNMRDELTQASLKMAATQNDITGALFHSDFGSQYTSNNFKVLASRHEITQSMSLAKLSCYGNAKQESIFGRFKVEAIYERYDTKNMSMESVKRLVFRYFMSYWNNRRISSANGGMPPRLKRMLYYKNTRVAA